MQADEHAPRNYPRYALTPAGREAWEEAVATARANVQGFFGAPVDLTGVAPAPTPVMPRGSQLNTPGLKISSTRVFECPRCFTVITADNLRLQLGRANAFACETCGKVLTDAARDFLDGRKTS